MRAALLIPGTCEAFYCENCLRDFDLVDALAEVGCDVEMVPLYLPLTRDDSGPHADAPIFFGGINVYLQERSRVFRHTPRWLDRLLDSRRLLRWAARRAEMTSAQDLGRTTVSMLRGSHGHQAKELARLVAHLEERERPEVVLLSSALLVGLADGIRQGLGVPVVSMLQDEDGFLDGLGEPYTGEAWEAVRDGVAHLDALVAVSEYYGAQMTRRLGVDPRRMRVVRMGINLDGYAPAAEPPDPPVIGFLSPAIPAKGLDLLIEAWRRLRERPGLERTRLSITGGTTAGSRPFLAAVGRQLAEADLTGHVEFYDRFGRRDRQQWLPRLSVLSVPTTHPEAFGAYVLEAGACGVPVVEPRHGALVELVEGTRGGVLVEPNDPEALAEALAGLLSNPEKAHALGDAGRRGVEERFTVQRAARDLLTVLEDVTQGNKEGAERHG